MCIAIWQLKIGVILRIVAHCPQHVFLLSLGEYTHAGCRKEEERRVRDFFSGNVFERMLEEFLEVFGADILRVFAESRYTYAMVC
jgi:hypothetical protein